MAEIPPHGVFNRYKNYGCRCVECRAANTKAQSDYMATHPEQREKKRLNARKGTPRRGPVHGAQSGVNWHKTHKTPLCIRCMNFKQAKTVVARAARQESLAPCGTTAAIRRHYRHHEPIDEICRVAFNLSEQKRRKPIRKAQRAKRA